jgi:hypothetical protein
MFDAIESFNRHEIADSIKLNLYLDLIESLQDQDWGSTDECLGQDPVLDDALEIVNRRWCKKHGYDYDEMFGDGA